MISCYLQYETNMKSYCNFLKVLQCTGLLHFISVVIISKRVIIKTELNVGKLQV